MRRRLFRNPAVPGKGEEGFTLLEILVAFVVLAIGLGTISIGIALATRSDSRMKSSATALLLAQSRLEAVGISEPLVPGRSGGYVHRKFRWRQTINEVRLPADSSEKQQGGGPQGSPNSPRAFWVSVVVEAADGTQARLGVLKIASRTSP